MSDEKKKYIYERNPDTGEIRRREFNDYEKVEIVEPSRSPDAPWIDERVTINKDGELLKEDKDDEQDDRQLSIPFYDTHFERWMLEGEYQKKQRDALFEYMEERRPIEYIADVGVPTLVYGQDL